MGPTERLEEELIERALKNRGEATTPIDPKQLEMAKVILNDSQIIEA